MQIDLQHINKSFGSVHANKDISLTFAEGRIIGILGENGAGKSTLMKILSGYQAADSGTILVDNTPVDYHGPLAALSNGIGMLQQDPLDVGAFTVLENFIFGSTKKNLFEQIFLNNKTAQQQLEQLCQRFGFQLDPDLLISELSIAQRQQLEIIRLLAQNVRTLILDEPTTGISADQKELLFNTLREMTAEGMTILLVSHKLEDVVALCDEVVVLRAGEVVGQRTMPVSKNEMIAMMFGDELPIPERRQRNLGISPTILELQNVTMRAGRLTIHNLNLALRQGEVLGLAGLDDSGQELIMRVAAGLHSLESGDLRLNDRVVTGKHYHQLQSKGVVFAAAGRIEEGLVAGLRLTEHVALTTSRDTFIDWKAAKKETEAKIFSHNVRGQADDFIEQLSGGNQQRVLMSLIPPSPSVMILENPMRGLDVDSASLIWEKLLERCESGTALLFSSPDLDEILTYSDRILVCYAGETFLIDDPNSMTNTNLGYMIGGEFAR